MRQKSSSRISTRIFLPWCVDLFRLRSDKNNSVKQADTIMLTYPLNWNMSRDIMRNDLEYYEQLTTERTPAMTWSFFTVGWKWVDDDAKATAYFLKSYQDYLIQPFKVRRVRVVWISGIHCNS